MLFIVLNCVSYQLIAEHHLSISTAMSVHHYAIVTIINILDQNIISLPKCHIKCIFSFNFHFVFEILTYEPKSCGLSDEYFVAFKGTLSAL